MNRPIRVVLFTGGPSLDHAVQRFAWLLDQHAEIELLAVFCQSSGKGPLATVQDLWKRRGVLALPLLLRHMTHSATRRLSRPREERQLRQGLDRLAGRVSFVSDIHADAVLARVRALDPDLGLIYGGPILKPKLFRIPRLGTLGIHHGKVPRYRGKKTTFWAMYEGEETAGLMIQRVNAGVDTGEVILKGEVPIGNKSVGQVTRELEELGIDLYLRAILQVKHGTASFTPQEPSEGRLYTDPTIIDIWRFWQRQLARRFRPR